MFAQVSIALEEQRQNEYKEIADALLSLKNNTNLQCRPVTENARTQDVFHVANNYDNFTKMLASPTVRVNNDKHIMNPIIFLNTQNYYQNERNVKLTTKFCSRSLYGRMFFPCILLNIPSYDDSLTKPTNFNDVVHTIHHGNKFYAIVSTPSDLDVKYPRIKPFIDNMCSSTNYTDKYINIFNAVGLSSDPILTSLFRFYTKAYFYMVNFSEINSIKTTAFTHPNLLNMMVFLMIECMLTCRRLNIHFAFLTHKTQEEFILIVNFTELPKDILHNYFLITKTL
jgi:hypothetical protein